MRSPLPARLLALAAVALLAAGCGGKKVVDEKDVERSARDAVAEALGMTPRSVDCPGDLDAKAGAKERCTLVDNRGRKHVVTVRVDSVKGDQARYTVLLGNK